MGLSLLLLYATHFTTTTWLDAISKWTLLADPLDQTKKLLKHGVFQSPQRVTRDVVLRQDKSDPFMYSLGAILEVFHPYLCKYEM